VSDAASEAATESEADAWRLRLSEFDRTRQAAAEGLYGTNDLAQTLHRNLFLARLPKNLFIKMPSSRQSFQARWVVPRVT